MTKCGLYSKKSYFRALFVLKANSFISAIYEVIKNK